MAIANTVTSRRTNMTSSGAWYSTVFIQSRQPRGSEPDVLEGAGAGHDSRDERVGVRDCVAARALRFDARVPVPELWAQVWRPVLAVQEVAAAGKGAAVRLPTTEVEVEPQEHLGVRFVAQYVPS